MKCSEKDCPGTWILEIQLMFGLAVIPGLKLFLV
jgi:hypothetical protein